MKHCFRWTWLIYFCRPLILLLASPGPLSHTHARARAYLPEKLNAQARLLRSGIDPERNSVRISIMRGGGDYGLAGFYRLQLRIEPDKPPIREEKKKI